MKNRLALILLSFILSTTVISLPSFSQSETHDFVTYDTLINAPYAGIQWRVRISRPVNMFTVGHPDAAPRPALITIPGQGEMGTNYAKLQAYGPHYWLNNGWDGGITLGNGKHYPILITIISSNTFMTGREASDVIDILLSSYRIKSNSVHVAGLSQGAFALSSSLLYSVGGDERGMRKITSMVCLQGRSSEVTGGNFQPESGWGHWAKKYGGTFFGLEGTVDVREVWRISNSMQDSVAGSAYFSYENIGGGTHCCWNTMYNPNNKLWSSVAPLGTYNAPSQAPNGINRMGTYQSGWSIFEWMLRQGDTSMVDGGTVTNQPPVVSAGADQSIVLPLALITTAGTASDPDGTIVSRQWTKVSGPAAVITTPANLVTTITGLTNGTYVFRLSATDDSGATVSDDMTVTVGLAANQLPTANAGADQTITLPTNSVTLTGGASDPDGSIQSQTWSKVSGGAATIVSPSALSTAITGLVAGNYVFRLTVTDNAGGTDTDDIAITVNSAPPPPPANNGPKVIRKVAITEYKVGYLYSDSLFYTFVNNIMQPLNLGGRKVIDVSAGFNKLFMLDDQGYVWENVIASTIPIRVEQDTTGAPFNNNIAIFGDWYNNTSIRSDSSLWYWGRDEYNLFPGTNPITRPIQLSPAGMKVKKVIMSQIKIIVLTTNGQVWHWTKNGSLTPTQWTLPRPAIDIFGSSYNFQGCLIPDAGGNPNMGYPYIWGTEFSFWGGNTGYTQPTSMKTLWNLTVPVKEIAANTNTIHFIDSLGRLFGIGDNPNGEIGNGQELVNKYTYPTQYAWSWNKGEAYSGAPPIQVGVGTTWKKLFKSNTISYFVYATDSNDSLYSWGRDKALVLGNGRLNFQEATYPNVMDVLTPTQVTPISAIYQAYDWHVGVVNAGADQTTSSTSITLSGSAIAPYLSARGTVQNGQPTITYPITGYQWIKVSGPACTITSPNQATSTVTGLTPGTYVFRLVATDSNTGTRMDEVTITVSAPAGNQNPLPNAGPDQTITLPTSSVTMAGSGSDPDGSIATIAWTRISGPAATITNASSYTTTITGLTAGTYVFRLTVTDNGGASAFDEMTVVVNAAPNQVPTVNAGPNQTITLPTSSITMAGTASDPDGSIATRTWTKTSGPAATITTPSSLTTTITGLVAGTYVFRLTVTDNGGASAFDEMTVVVNAAANQTPLVNAGPDQTITLPTSNVTMAGTASDPDGTISTIVWSKTSGPAATITTPASLTTTITGLVAGTYVFRLTVTDNGNTTSYDEMTVTVNAAPNQPPVANAGTDITITLPINSVQLTGSGTDPDGNIATYSWSKISGPAAFTITSPTSAQTNVGGLTVGTYIFRLTVTDNSGATDTDDVTVTVNAAVVPTNQLPIANAGTDITITAPVNSVDLSGSGTDPDGTISSYLWTVLSGPAGSGFANANAQSTAFGNLVEGIYVVQLQVIDNNGGVGLDTVRVVVLGNTNTRPGFLDFRIYPNPANDQVNAGIAFDSTGEKYSIVIYSMNGEKVYQSSNLVSVQGGVVYPIDISRMQKGVYVMRLIFADDRKVFGTFVKQ